jgi:hypothetical protein
MAELSIERMALNAQAARRIGDDRTADYWTERVEQENLRLEREHRHSEWRVLVDNRHG